MKVALKGLRFLRFLRFNFRRLTLVHFRKTGKPLDFGPIDMEIKTEIVDHSCSVIMFCAQDFQRPHFFYFVKVSI